jgi:hypothetical protein
MPIFEITRESIEPVATTTFHAQGFAERSDLQRLLRKKTAVIAPDTYVLAEEYGDWQDSKRRIDLLCLDKSANVVVIELKRTEDGGHMELQAIRYAAMVSRLTFKQAVVAHTKYRGDKEESGAEEAILSFLGWDEPHPQEFAKDTRIILVAAEFSKEITTSALWLRERRIDIRCVRLRPYLIGERTLLDIQEVVPLPEAEEFQIQIRNKAEEERQSADGEAATMYQERNEEILKNFRRLMPGQRMPENAPPKSYMPIRTGYGSIHYEFVYRGRGEQRRLQVAVHFENPSKERNCELMEFLKKHAAKLEQALGEEVMFVVSERTAGWSSAYVEKTSEPWSEEIAQWAAKKMCTLIQVVQPLLEKHLGEKE